MIPCKEALLKRQPGEPDPWFPTTEKDHEASGEAHFEFAKRQCRTCPIVQACGEGALERREPYGVWGGLSPADREKLYKGLKAA